jgi:hypothetical protein
MTDKYIVREFKNGVKHFWDTDEGSCIHWTKVKDRIPKNEFDKLFEEFNGKQPKKEDVTKSLPNLSDILTEVISAYSDKMSIEEIVGALELCKTDALTLRKTKIN